MKLHYLTNLRFNNLIRSLFFLLIIFLLIMVKVQAQPMLPTGFNNISTSTYADYIIPDGIREIRIILTGGRGGLAWADACRKTGGKGAQVASSFFVGNNVCANNMFVLRPGGTLRIIKGGDGKGDFSSGDDALGSGGGGSAALYLAPDASQWVLLLVAGGGGGAAASEGLIGNECLGFDGKNAELDESGSKGAGNNFGGGGSGGNGGGAGGVIDGDGGGGGGAYTDGADGTISGIGGDKGGTAGGNGGNSSLDDILRNGGFGFGGGGAGRIAAGGGGGYSGGGGGGKDAYTPGGGGGGGSFVIAGAFNVIKTLDYSSTGLSTNTVSGSLPVNKLYVKKDAVGSNDGSSWANAFVDLQDALAVAANNCLTEIWVAKGTYYPDEVNGQNTNNRSSSFIVKSGVKLYGGFSGNETDLSQRNWFNNKTYLSGDLLQDNTEYDNAQFLNYADNAYHVVRSQNTDNTSVLDGFYIQSGNANGTGEEDSGGGIYMSNAGMTVVNCDVSFNHAYQGSGIYLLTSSPLILNCYFKSNKAISGGAGVYNNTNSSGYFYNCVFQSNQVGTTTPAGGGGGAIVNYNNSSPDFVNCTISGNDAKTGGAVYNLTNAHPNFYNTIIWNNKSVLTEPISTDGSSSMGYFHCLVQGIDLSVSNGNLNAVLLNSTPFESDVDLSQTPVATGNLQLNGCSVGIDKGGEFFDQAVDIIGNPRTHNNTIDLGAYEFIGNLTPCYARLYVKWNAAGSNDGNSWINAFTKLPDALGMARSIISNLKLQVQIWVTEGTYYTDEGVGFTNDLPIQAFLLTDSIEIYGGFAGTETTAQQSNPQTHITILSGEIQQDDDNSNNAYHVLFGYKVKTRSVLYGCTISGGCARNSTENDLGGGGMYNLSSPGLLIANCIFTENTAYDGGGILNAASSVELINCRFSENRATNTGGGIYNIDSSPTLTNCNFLDNMAVFGGGMINFFSPSPVLTNCSFSENTVTNSGSGIYNVNSSPMLTNCSFSENTVTNSGGVINNVNSSPTLTNCIVWGNTEPIHNSGVSFPVVTYSIVQGGYVGAGNSNKNPLFTDAVNGNLRLQSCSPAIEAGSNAAVTATTDLDGNSRISNATMRPSAIVDMGAYEFVGNISAPTYYRDADEDGYGDPANSILACTIPTGYVADHTDCDDSNGVINPATSWYQDADQDGFGNPAVSETNCEQPPGYVLNANDCNDATNQNQTIVYVNKNATGLNDGSSWLNAYINLQDALVNLCGTITQVWVAKGTYYPDKGGGKIDGDREASFVLKNVAIYGGFNGGETQVNLRNWLENKTILCGNIGEIASMDDNSYHVVNTVSGLNSTAILDGFTIEDGHANGPVVLNLFNRMGAGIFSWGSSPTVANCIIRNNKASFQGGGLWTSGGTQYLTNVEFIANEAQADGALFAFAKNITITNSVFYGNRSNEFQGYSVVSVHYGDATFTNCNFVKNHNPVGPLFSNIETQIKLSNCIVWENEVAEIGLQGDIGTHARVTIDNSIIPGSFYTWEDEYVSNIINVDPQFVDINNYNLRLQASSPAVNAGLDAANNTPFDLDVNPRKVGTIDMGAYEFGSSTPSCTDETAPVFTGSYADVDLGCNPANPDGSLGSATATDASGTLTITSTDGSVVSDGCNRSKTRTFTATDGCNNSSTTSRTIRWIADLTPPLITCPANLQLACNVAIPAPNTANVTVADACPGSVTVQHVSTVLQGTSNCGETWIRTYKATDACGNTAACTQTITRTLDINPPAFTGSYTDVTLGCNPANPDGSLGSASATDGCGAVTITQSDGAVVSYGCNRSRTRIFTATDGCLNTSTTSRTIRWIADLTPPVFTGSYTDLNLGCNPGNPDGSLGSASATDGCGAVTITQSDGAVVSYGCNRSRTRTFTATDGCLNTSTTSRTVRWISDLTPPVFTGSYADVNLGCNPANPDGSLGSASATDGCGAVTITQSDGAVVSNGCNRSRTRTFTATDGSLNTSTTSRTVRWMADIIPPSFTGYYSDVNLTTCNPANPDGSLGTATATDGCGAVTITSSDGAVVSNGCNRSRTRTFTATDGCLNTSTASRTVRWIYDVTAPALVCAKTGTVTKSTNQGLCTYAVDGNEFNPTASDVCSAPSLAWSVSGETTASGNTTMAGVLLNFGNNTIKWTATDACGNTSTCSFIVNVNKVTTTTSLVVSTTPASNPVTQQYSDKITCVATVTNCPNAGPIGGTVTFKIINAQGTVVLGTAPVASDGTATLTAPLLENQFYSGNGPLRPGNKTVTAEYSGTDPDYIVTNPPGAPLIVNCEDVDITYNGLNYFGANPNTNQGTITVSAFVLDANDVPAQARGDIRNATVTFKEGTSVGTAIGTANIPVGLVNPTNFQEGIVTTNKPYTLTGQEISYGGKIVDVWAGVNNYYCGEVAEVVPVCLSLPGGDFVTGGGWIKMLNSEGSYAGTDDKKMHAALVFKWNKSNKNLQGNATIIYKRVANGIQKVYQVKSNSITSMIVNNVNDAGTAVTTGATYRMAQIVTKANFRDLTDPDLPITLLGNLTLTITAWESINTTDGSKDRISVQLMGSGSEGLIFSSNWLSGATQWQQIGGGKMRVRNPSAEIPCTNCSGSGITAKTGEVDKTTETIPVTDDLKVTVMPNPSSTNFRIIVNSNDLKEPVKLFITDMLGRVVETRITNAGQTITIGDKYISGTYAVRIMQGRKTKQLTLIKLSD